MKVEDPIAYVYYEGGLQAKVFAEPLASELADNSRYDVSWSRDSTTSTPERDADG